MRSLPLTLTIEDFNLLMDQCISTGLSEFNKKKLEAELKDAKIVQKENLPLNVVCANTKVMVYNLDKKQTFSIHIVQPGRAHKTNKISMTDPMAIALLGYPTGAIIEWEMPDGINRLQVISVYQDEGVEI